MNGGVLAGLPDRARNGEVADWVAVAIAVSLPWSTSATSILIVLWIAVVFPSRDTAAVLRLVMTPAGGLPVLLWGLAAVGMLWADVSWSERIDGIRGFNKLLLVPLFLAHFRRSQQVKWVILGFVGSSAILLLLSSVLMSSPGGLWGREKADAGVPVKDYIAQSGIFAICAFGFLGASMELLRKRRFILAMVFISIAALFIGNIAYVATARTTLVVIVVLLILFGFLQFGWKGIVGVALLGTILTSIFWVSSPYFRERVSRIGADIHDYEAGDPLTSVGLRIEYWKKSTQFIATAPLIGHGTGAVGALFRQGKESSAAIQPITGNPHSQILAIAVQLGFLGAIVLIAMWMAHLALFRQPNLVSWFGLVVVAQNIVSSLFNSHLFDFVQGWIYVFGVGLLGGAVLSSRAGSGNLHRG
jgi:O-antigen ligase